MRFTRNWKVRRVSASAKVGAAFWSVIIQIMLLDIVFSLDSVITAVGMVDRIEIMIAAVIIAAAVMVFTSTPLANFVERHPTVKMLALSFLLLIGFTLIVEGLHQHIPKGYIYFAMGFSVLVEMLNLRLRGNRASQSICMMPMQERRKQAVSHAASRNVPCKDYCQRRNQGRKGDSKLESKMRWIPRSISFCLVAFRSFAFAALINPTNNGCGFIGLRQKLGVELAADHEGMILDLRDFDQFSIR